MGSKDSERIRGASWRCAPPGGPLTAQPASDHRRAVAERNGDGILAAAGRLLEALVERAVRESVSAIEGAEPARGPAADALRRVIDATWEQLGRHEGIGRGAAAGLSSHGMRRSHRSAHRLLRELFDRGRSEGAFRHDVSADWLVTSFFALVHVARDEVIARRKTRAAALNDLRITLHDLFVSGGRPPAQN